MKYTFLKSTLKITCSIIISTSLFFLTKPYIVNALIDDTTPISKQPLILDTIVDSDNYTQVLIKDFKGNVIYQTSELYPHSIPIRDSNYVVWTAQIDSKWHVFYYDLTSEKQIQLTFSGNNVNPKVSNGMVVWEGQVDGIWQVFLFDGVKVSQITHEDYPAQDVDINDKYITYSQKLDTGWDAFLYDTESDEHSKMVIPGKQTKFSGDALTWISIGSNDLHTYGVDTIRKPPLVNEDLTEDTTDTIVYQEFLNKNSSGDNNSLEPILESVTKESTPSENSSDITNNDTKPEDIKLELNSITMSNDDKDSTNDNASIVTDSTKTQDHVDDSIDSVNNENTITDTTNDYSIINEPQMIDMVLESSASESND